MQLIYVVLHWEAGGGGGGRGRGTFTATGAIWKGAEAGTKPLVTMLTPLLPAAVATCICLETGGTCTLLEPGTHEGGVWVTEATAVLGSLGVRGGDGGAGDLCSSTASNANWALVWRKEKETRLYT